MKQETLQLTTGGDPAKRRALDFYPTPKNVTIALMDFLKLPISKIWEPACGNGSMSKVLEYYEHEVYSSDIADSDYGHPNVDFLSTSAPKKFDAIITNPPFSLSVEFIKKALSEAPMVAMLLKSQYWHAKDRYQLFINNPPCFVLPLTWRPDFLEHERKPGEKKGTPTMEVHWTVWRKGYSVAQYIPLPKPKK